MDINNIYEVKAHGLDLLIRIEQLQKEYQMTIQQVAKLSQPVEQPKVEEAKVVVENKQEETK